MILPNFQGLRGGASLKIKSIDLVYNQDLENAFEARKLAFKSATIPAHEVFAFHGTLKTNINSIVRTNLQYQVFIHFIKLMIKIKFKCVLPF